MNANFFPNPDYPSTEFGITKRELFAAMAMQGMLSNNLKVDMKLAKERGCNTVADFFTKAAVIYADALIAELAKEKKG